MSARWLWTFTLRSIYPSIKNVEAEIESQRSRVIAGQKPRFIVEIKRFQVNKSGFELVDQPIRKSHSIFISF